MRWLRAGAGCPDLADTHAGELAAVVPGPAAVEAAPDRRTGGCGQQDAVRATVERNLARVLAGALPKGDHGRRIVPGWPGALRHAKRGQCEHSRAWVIGQDPGVTGSPPGAELGPVEEWCHQDGGADGAYDAGHLVGLGEVLADQ